MTRIRALSGLALVGLLAASALTPVIATVGGAGAVLAAGAGVLGSLGANVLTEVVTGAIGRLQGGDASPERVRDAVALRIEAFRDDDSADRGLLDEVIGLFQAVDVAGTALRAAAADNVAPALAEAFSELTILFGEFTFARWPGPG